MTQKLNTRIVAAFCTLVSVLMISCGSANIQPAPDSVADSLLTFDQANLRLNDWRAKIAALDLRMKKLDEENKALEDKLVKEIQSLKKCNEEIYALIGASEADVNAFRERLGRLEGQIREMRSLSDEQFEQRRNEVYSLASEWNKLRSEKSSILPEFFDRMIAARRDIQSLFERKSAKVVKGYVVRSWQENKDCLWNIAGQSEIYGDPFQWTKLWQGNAGTIRNPDVIFPGQQLTVPPAGSKTPEEQKAERLYYRNKRKGVSRAIKIEPLDLPAPTTIVQPSAKGNAVNPAPKVEVKKKSVSTERGDQ